MDEEVGAGADGGTAAPPSSCGCGSTSAPASELTALIGDAEAVDWIAARLTLAAEARVVAVALTTGERDAAALAFQLEQQIAGLSARRSVRALGLGPVVERARVRARGARVVLELAVSEDERETVSQRLAALAQALRSREPRSAGEP